MSITTKNGDSGKTRLFSGEEVWKDDSRVQAYGTVDELQAFLGEAKHYAELIENQDKIDEIQILLFRVSAEIASQKNEYNNSVNDDDIAKLEIFSENLENKMNLKGFVLRGQTKASAKLDICCTIARRAERKTIFLLRNEEISQTCLKFINRLSDLLFLMARYEEFCQGKIKYLISN
ncbi:MAG: cob(I)yrinic acid a,c-diamide adenosyltransferase [Candidatus Cloacimonetes bacterium]|nr:cob(I)yrinic acid a,c-diamide adenosyltransferase [Candidatus Cloacimonadota bacterium]